VQCPAPAHLTTGFSPGRSPACGRFASKSSFFARVRLLLDLARLVGFSQTFFHSSPLQRRKIPTTMGTLTVDQLNELGRQMTVSLNYELERRFSQLEHQVQTLQTAIQEMQEAPPQQVSESPNFHQQAATPVATTSDVSCEMEHHQVSSDESEADSMATDSEFPTLQQAKKNKRRHRPHSPPEVTPAKQLNAGISTTATKNREISTRAPQPGVNSTTVLERRAALNPKGSDAPKATAGSRPQPPTKPRIPQ
jgi:hypothetical protein